MAECLLREIIDKPIPLASSNRCSKSCVSFVAFPPHHFFVANKHGLLPPPIMESRGFGSLWRTKKKHEAGPEKAGIGVLAFEVASLMSKLVQLWQLLSDKQVARLKEEISNSVGIQKLVSDNDDFIVGLICVELFENMVRVAKSVARLGKNCSDPSLKGFEHAISDLINNGVDPYGWVFSWKKMERKAKKMEKFISINANLYERMEVLSDLEQTLRRNERQ
ncbi:hypothetical protein M0R45_035665 [Rubus argutus]|uniref:DUF3475 domain-containing protein n=1 Tax=Rubus argutus TaxID=59490 RepID=A0AAW1VVC2_RUBAR